MRWTLPQFRYAPERTKRDVVRFAWLPVTCDTDDEHPQRVWLERYISHEEWTPDAYYGWRWSVIARYTHDVLTNAAVRSLGDSR